MKKLGLLAALVLGLAVGALADKTYTELLAGSAVNSMTFDVTQPGKVIAIVCGQAPLAGGGTSKPNCYSTVLTSGTIFTQVNTLAAGQALVFWQQQEGL